VELNPYVSALVRALDERDDELARVRRSGSPSVAPHGIVAGDIVLLLRLRGDVSAPRLSRELNLEEEVIVAYANALVRLGWVTLGMTSRGVTLVCPKRLPAGLDLEAPEENAA
jgi:hypothetical protein